ncbi:DUF134 domain-containing protein [Halochromatium glycolicum]|uniref:DUF134 domain-containing protein n=1 Tax=Halochromatium glycolicum TaxID=85075 RepID=UPI0023EF20E5|nr:DUF134 domain-containing protein [Halochromatium glycolicum]
MHFRDLEGLYQAEAAARMGVSRTTLARILTRARRTVTAALIGGERLLLDTDAATADPEPDHAIQSP